MSIEIRVAGAEDLPRLFELDQECFPTGSLDLEPAPAGEIQEGVEAEAIYVALDNERIVGMLQLDMVSSNQWELLTLAITTDFRGKGVGKALMERMLLRLNQSPYLVAVSCLTSPNNFAMQALLESFGFLQVGLVENHYGPGKNRLKFQLN